jgi:hypothetical protein
MGQCSNCNKSIKIIDNEKVCPSCGKIPYKCWNCHKEIVMNNECPLCHFFYCENCGLCGRDCRINIIIDAFSLQCFPQPTSTMISTFRKTVQDILLLETGKRRLICPERNVPITYAHTRNRDLLKRLNGTSTRSKEDEEAFKDRFAKMKSFPIGTSWRINEVREDGFNGQEDRDVSNLMVCMGFASLKFIPENKEKNIPAHFVYFREDIQQCPFFQPNNVIITQKCKKCNKGLPEGSTHCDFCTYTKGTKKGEKFESVDIKSVINPCNIPRKDFKFREAF